MRVLIPALAAAAAVVLAAALLYEEPPAKVYENDFEYSDIAILRDALADRGLRLSAGTEITDHTTDLYCTYFDADDRRHSAPYCITTALVDSEETVGNINLGGKRDGRPVMAVALVEDAPGDPARAKKVFEVMVEELVCDCWAGERPGGFASVGEWVDVAQDRFEGSDRDSPLKSRISGIDQKELVLELSSAEGMYLWVLVVAK